MSSGDRHHLPCDAETPCSGRRESPADSSATYRPLGRPGIGPLGGALLLLTLYLSNAAPAGADALNNPGFESGFTGWLETDPAAISTSDVNSGTRAAKITGASGRIEQAVTVTVNTDYRLTAWVFEHGTVGVDLGISEVTRSGSYGAYTQVTVNFNSGSATSVTIFAAYNGGTGRFDDFALESLDGSMPTPSGGCSSLEQLKVASVTASAHDGNVPANALDDNLGTRWSAGGAGQWIRFDLGEVVDVEEVDIAWYKGDQRLFDFDIEASSDGSTWSLVHAGTSSGTTTAPETYDVTDSTARYVRIVGYGNTSNDWNSITEVDIYGCGQGLAGEAPPLLQPPGDLDPNMPPGQNFDLSTWKITFPDASEEKEAWLVGGGESPNEFFTDPLTGGMVFRCPNLAGSTSGSSYSRTELREMLRAGDTSISTTGLNQNNWVLSSSSSSNQKNAGGVDGTLRATLTVDHVSTSGDATKVGRVIIGQIHASNNEPLRLYYRKLPGNSKGSIYFAHEPATGSEQWYEVIGSLSDSASNPPDGISLGEAFSYIIDVSGNMLTVTIQRDGKGDVVRTVDMSASGFADDWMYFKAGVYNQNNTGSGSDYVQATFYALSNRHD